MSARPWFKFWPADWRADSALQGCSIGARGLWLEMILLMHSGKPYGHLTRPNGELIDTPKLARACQIPLNECRGFVAELQRADVFSVSNTGAIYSRKMVREKEKADRDLTNGRKGGNPNLRKVAGSNGGGLTPALTGITPIGI